MIEPISSCNNAILRLQSIARSLPDCPERRWLEDATWAVIDGQSRLDEALGVVGPPGWRSPRVVLLHDRRDGLLRDFYDRCYRGVSLRAAAAIMLADHHRLLARWGRMRPRLALISRSPATALGFHELLAAEGHAMPGISQLRQILRRAVVRPVADLPAVETGRPAGPTCGDAA